MAKREFTSPYLSDWSGGKVVVTCPTCGMKRRYDVNAMLTKIEDRPMPSVLPVIARAEGCDRVDNLYSDRCTLHYDFEAMRQLLP